jgi:hypothetical protein
LSAPLTANRQQEEVLMFDVLSGEMVSSIFVVLAFSALVAVRGIAAPSLFC